MLKSREKILSHFSTDAQSGVAVKDHLRRKKIIAQISIQEEITINDISDSLNISVPKATEVLGELIREGFVVEKGKRSEGPGRKATYYGLADNSCFFIGVEIKKYKLNLGIMAFDKTMVTTSHDIPFYFEDATDSLGEIVKQVRRFIEESNVPLDKIIGMGVSISGRTNVITGQILTIYHFADAPIKQTLENEFEMPVYLDNDSRTMAYGEFYFGKRNNEQEVLVVNLDYGLALGIFVNGSPVFGASGYAGELGHIPLFTNEKICYCGKKGCLETEASGRALIEWMSEKMKSGSNSTLNAVMTQKGLIELEDVVLAARRGDNLALEGIGIIAGKIGRGLAVTLNLFNPQLIVISGSLSEVGESLLLPVKTALLQHSLSVVNADTAVVLSSLNQKAGLLGCCLLVRDKIVGLV